MANLPEAATWEGGIYQLELTDPVQGGPDGISNNQAKQLANRTAYLKQEVELRAPIASPVFTGNPTVPTQPPGNNSLSAANTAFVQAAIAALVASSPAALDTLNELAAALGDDPNFATTVMNALALKAPLNSPALTGTPTAPTQAPGDSSLALSTTEFVQQAVAGFQTVPVGAEMDWPFETPPAGWYEADGALISRVDAAALWQRASQSNLIVSEAFWLSGQTGYYSVGDGSTTFRLPDFRGYFSRAWDHGRGIDSGRGQGNAQEDAFQGHTHYMERILRAGPAGTTNYPSFEDSEGTADETGQPISDGTNGIPRIAAETRPKNIARMRIIYAGNQ
ncbi:bacteriophage tail fiber protein [Tepidicaulis marinus]|uniref:Bacteriophage tail fiber protein n=1 Tax=Tepidicaulis marinus TaxID=1333998 RepID=A0A081B6C9_9HYPH|nr:phage tail protein [Tepidicaulis marinus]GAK43597.1 bacteriophage tail fiber protein [Tepidicaulis marinus]